MPDAPRNQRLLALFAAGSELAPAERAAFLARECADDDALRRELADLLAVEADGLGAFLAAPAVPAAIPAAVDLARVSAAPRIAGYEDFEPVAQGGMGTVYKARQVSPVRRTVAVKLIRPGADTGEVLRRFEAERQALARMSHPYIAAVHDAGVDELGRPYIAMEYVDGAPLTEHCEREALPLEARLGLFVQVCEAVDHAHRRGVLHRDLKPSNVLVRRVDDQTIPKVIDFGIAKALEGSLGEQSIHTLDGALLGTPEYMSPEQLEGPASRVDTRSDVYALGVMLYELVTHVRPIDAGRLHESGIVKLHKILTEEVPAKPSTRLRELLATKSERVATLAEPARWVRRIEGDLDWVVMKALEKEPELRYGSAHELAADVESFLADRPVTAGPPSGLYLVRKFARRHRAQVVAAALVLLSLVVGLFGTLWFLAASLRSEAAAEERAKEAEAARRAADGVRLATEASILAEESPNLALLLALEAARETDSSAVHQTIHRALPHQSQAALLVGHDYGTRQALYLPDGRLVTRGVDPWACLWEPDSGRLVRRFGGDWAALNEIALDAAGRRLATAADDGTARVWDLERGDGIACATRLAAPALAVALSPDGARCAVGSADGVALVFDARTGAVEHELPGSAEPVLSIAFDPSGARLAVLGLNHVTRVFDADTGALVRELPASGALPAATREDGGAVLFSPGGEWVVSSTSRGGPRVRVDALDGERVLDLEGAYAPSFVDDDRLFLALPDGVGTAALASGDVVRRPWRVGEELWILETSRDARLAVALDARSDLCLVDLEQLRVIRPLRDKNDKRGRYVDVAFHPDGTRVATTGDTVRVWRIAPELQPFDVPGEGLFFDHLALASGAETLVLARRGTGDRPAFELWSFDRRERLAVLAPGLREVRMSPDAGLLVGVEDGPRSAFGEPSSRAVVLDLAGRRLHEIELPPQLRALELTPDGRRIAASHGSGQAPEVTFFDLATGETLDTIRLQFDVASSRRRVPLAEALTWRQSSFSTVVLDRRTGELVARALGPDRSSHTSRALSPDGRYLLVTDGGFKAWTWELATDRAGPDAVPLARYRNLVRENLVLSGFAVGAGGGELAWVKCANEVHLFEPATAAPFSVLRLDDGCAAVATSADGRSLFTVTRSGRCQRWPLDTLDVARRLAVGRLDARDLENYLVGTPEERRERTRAFFRDRPTPYGHSQLGELALADGDLDEAIACYERAWELQPLRLDYDLYLRLAELLCRRLERTDRAPDAAAADRSRAVLALEHAARFGASDDEVRGVPGVERLRGEPGAERFLP